MPLLKEIGEKLENFKNCPATAIWGDLDFCFNNDFLRKWNNILPNLQIMKYPDAGHYVLEDAGEQGIEDIRAAFRKIQTT